MLYNLISALFRKGIESPTEAIVSVLGCSSSVAARKLKGQSSFTVSEVVKITETYFTQKEYSIEYLFLPFSKNVL